MVKKSPPFYGTWRFIIVFTRATKQLSSGGNVLACILEVPGSNPAILQSGDFAWPFPLRPQEASYKNWSMTLQVWSLVASRSTQAVSLQSRVPQLTSDCNIDEHGTEYSGTSVIERLSSRTNRFPNIKPKQKTHRFPNRVSVPEQANWQPPSTYAINSPPYR
jgi:hypothetical protein